MGALGDFFRGDEFDQCMKIIRKDLGLDLLRIAKRLPKNEFENGRRTLLNNIRANGWNNYEAAVMGSRLFFEEIVIERNHILHIDRVIVQWAVTKKISKQVFFEYMVVYQELKKKFNIED